MNSKVTIHIRCPQCGGDIDFLEETTVIRCQYCGSSLLAAGTKGLHRYVIQPKHPERSWAEARSIEHLRSRGRDAPRPAETFLFYVPFWRIRGTVYCWIFGRHAHAVDSLTGGPVKERKKLLRTRILDHTVPGFEGVDLGFSSLGVRAQVLELREFRKEHLDKRGSFLP